MYSDWILEHKVYSPAFSTPEGASFVCLDPYMSQFLHGSFIPSTIANTCPDAEYGKTWLYGNYPQWPGDKNKLPLTTVWQWNLTVNNDRSEKQKVAACRLLNEWVVKDWMAWNETTGFVAGLKGIEKEVPSLKGPWQEKMSKDYEIARPCYPYSVHVKAVAQQMLEMLERIISGAMGVEESLLDAKTKIDAIVAPA